MWKVFVAFNVILFMTGLCSADVHEDHSRSKRFILGGDGVDLESVRKSLIDPSTISNQLTGAIVFPSIMVFGWLTGGVIYNALKTLDLSEGTRDYLERAEFAFGPDPMLISATRLIRNSVYGPTGRILFNAIFSPQETADEFRSFTIKEHVDRALSDSFLRGTVTKSLHNLFWDTLFLAIANSYTEAERSKRSAEDEEETSENSYSFIDHLIDAIQF